tara:strand:+ start:14170 stop:16284 length:2115 start_codon:yes stop_codon:yes gene_type:complete
MLNDHSHVLHVDHVGHAGGANVADGVGVGVRVAVGIHQQMVRWIAIPLLVLTGFPSFAGEATTEAVEEATEYVSGRLTLGPLAMPDDIIEGVPFTAAKRKALFGDMHVHTTYSFDAYAFGTLATPYDAYRYARGKAIQHPTGMTMKLRQPLDFYAVTDHAMFLGISRIAADPNSFLGRSGKFDYMHGLNDPDNQVAGGGGNRTPAFGQILGDLLLAVADGSVDQTMLDDITRSAWADTIAAADMFYQPGRFTTFVAYEYTTSSNDRGNLHRNVLFRDTHRLPAVPFSRFHSQNPERLWDWMDGLRAQGIEAMAIPHNMNGSNGQMFKRVGWANNPIDDAYAKQRIRNEPLIELTQIKGTSETHPLLSSEDEWADFEIMPYRIATRLASEPNGSYVRQALLTGLAFEDAGVANPYKFGFTGASDTHTGAIADDEAEFYGKIGLLDANGRLKGSVPVAAEIAKTMEQNNAPRKTFGDRMFRDGAPITWGASGLTGVWAEKNNRGAIYDALRRKESFATTGPRIRVRLFGGYGWTDDLLEDRDYVETSYRDGVPMGAELIPGDGAPTLIATAVRDAKSAPLQRLQIIKGWTEDGEHHEQVFDVACADGGTVDPVTQRCPDNGATVDLSDCSISGDTGDGELAAVWQDPQFEPAHRAFYYVRALENPTCRWSTWDALRAGEAPREDTQFTIQERAWSSPIWYNPDLSD